MVTSPRGLLGKAAALLLLQLLPETAAAALTGAHGFVPSRRLAANTGSERLSFASAVMAAAGESPCTLMVNGLPGAMGKEIAAACLRRGLQLAPYALSGPGQPSSVTVADGRGGPTIDVALYAPDQAEELAQRVKDVFPADSIAAGSFICIDFTHPSAVNGNAEWYAKHGLPFVMGTTGGDREQLASTVQESGIYCVVAPNMAKQIVALQAALAGMAEQFPGSFSGYSLRVQESHQSTKADTSGTAKAISAHLATLTAESDFNEARIDRVRDPASQLAGAGPSHRGVSPVPADAIDGHAYHTYSLESDDGKVEFQIRHNVQGRSTYAEGTVDAAVFLAKRVAGADKRRQFDMIDVLKSGEM